MRARNTETAPAIDRRHHYAPADDARARARRDRLDALSAIRESRESRENEARFYRSTSK